MKLDKKLNFIVPIEEADGTKRYVHSAPVGEAVFDKFFMTIGQAFNEIYGGGLGMLAGPRVAAKLIRRIAERTETLDGPDGVEAGFFGNIRRLSSYVAPRGDGSWEPIPLDEALAKGLLSAEDASEVENALAFFTVASCMHRRSELPTILEVVSRIWDAQTSSSNSTEFSASLRTSTAPENTGAKPKPSPIPA